MNLPTRKEWEEFGFTVPDELCQPKPEPKPAVSDLQRLIAHFQDHAKHCPTCGGGQWVCEMGEALMLGIGRAAIKESK